MFSTQIRTDLALEAHESINSHSPVHGVEVQEQYDKKSNTQITRVFITTKKLCWIYRRFTFSRHPNYAPRHGKRLTNYAA